MLLKRKAIVVGDYIACHAGAFEFIYTDAPAGGLDGTLIMDVQVSWWQIRDDFGYAGGVVKNVGVLQGGSQWLGARV